MSSKSDYQKAYYQANKDKLKQRNREYYLQVTEGVVKRRNGAIKSPEDPKDVVYEVEKKPVGRPKKPDEELKHPRRKPKEKKPEEPKPPKEEKPKRPVGRPKKPDEELKHPRKVRDPTAPKKPIGRPKKIKDNSEAS